MKILVVNDDGIMSEGIKALADFLSIKHDVIVVAPDGNRSAFSHSLSIYKDIVVKELKITKKYKTFAMSGTPADCVKFAMHHFADTKFDLVCSGINKGHNLGSDTVYSGTISACLEGNFFGVKGIAFSNYAHSNCDFNANIQTLESIFDKLFSLCSTDYTLNVNFPNGKENGVKIVPLGIHLYTDNYVKTAEDTYQLVGNPIEEILDENCDVTYAKKGYVTVTPIIYNRTATKTIENLKDFKF
jgi:5'-nucleotidase